MITARRPADLHGSLDLPGRRRCRAELADLALLMQGIPVESSSGGRPAGQIGARFRERLNHALLHPGMHGGELTLQVLLDDLAWIDGRDSQLGPVTATLREIGAWSPAGVGGAFARMFGGEPAGHITAAAMVYADIARKWGYLAPQRELTAAEYARRRRDAPPWAAGADRLVADVIEAFGPPSLWRPKYNPRWPASLAYVSARQCDPLVAFDFWQETHWSGGTSASRFGPEPVLRNVRWRTDGFEAGFTFTPVGRTLLAHDTSGA